MHICLVSLDYKPYRSSGLTIYAEDLARGLVEMGQRVTVLAAQRPGLSAHHWIGEVELYRVPIGALDWITYSWCAAKALHHLAGRERFQVVHFLDVHFAYAYRGPYVASLWQSFRQRLTARRGGPYHVGALDWARRQVYYRVAETCMERSSLARAAGLIASCHSTKNEFVHRYQVPPEQIDLVVQGIDTDFFRPVYSSDLRTRLGLDNCRILLSVGFMTPRKGMEYLAEAMHLLPLDVHLVIAGRWDPHYRPRFLRALGKAANRVHEIGFIPDGERPCYYSMADVYVAPSLLEGLGITPVEALACGTPAIVTSASSGTEEVGDGGLVVPPCDAPALAKAIRQLLEDNERRRQLGRRGRERAVQEFSYHRMAEGTFRTYERSQQAERG